MTFRFLCTLGSFQSYKVNNINKYFSFWGNYLPYYSFISRMLLFIFPCNSCFSLIDKTFKKHYRWTSQCQCNRKTPTCLTWQVSADFCVPVSALLKGNNGSTPILSVITREIVMDCSNISDVRMAWAGRDLEVSLSQLLPGQGHLLH